MDLRQINESFAVAGQITPEDIPQIRDMGYRGLICNRPDGEAPDQSDYDSIKQAAEEAGLQIRYVPVDHGLLRAEVVAAFQAAMDELPDPVLAYCRSGARSANIYQVAQTRMP